MASGNDPVQAAAALERAILERNRAVADDYKVLAVAAYVLGTPAGSSIALPADLDARASAASGKDLAAWLRDTERHHPAIVAARAAVQAARDEVVSARSADRPTIDLTANYYQNGSFESPKMCSMRRRPPWRAHSVGTVKASQISWSS